MDIAALLGELADLSSVDWPFSTVDAIMLRRPGKRPDVYYKPVDDRGLRQRFTLAHELGHLRLAWHIGNKACSIPTNGPGLLRTRRPEEQEADVFASCILVPNRWLRDLSASYGDNMNDLLSELRSAQVSTKASILALRRMLPAGWVFQINGQEPVHSRGTALPAFAGALTVRRNLDHEASSSGRLDLHGNTVRWWRLTGSYGLPDEDEDPRTTTELLRSAIRAHEPDHHNAVHLERVANGIVGGGTRDDAGKPAGELYASLLYRFRKLAVQEILTHPDFHMWLARKARDKAAKVARS